MDGLIRALDGTNLKTVIEFHGCVWHGCTQCFKNRSKLMPNGLTADESFQKTVEKVETIKNLGYVVKEFWECEVNRMLEQDPEMKLFFDSVEIQDPIDPRDGFYGGRTNATKLYHCCKPEEKIGYVDVCSLYPWVCKRGSFPLGHPTIITENFLPTNNTNHPYHGLIKCQVLPPKGLLHPVLPRRANGKLMFPLCARCADECQQEQCDHMADERCFWGTWCTIELYKALELGYQLLQISEVWHYTNWATFDGKDPKSGLFNEYIDNFLQLKQQASGWPDWIKNDEDKLSYLKKYKEIEGIDLLPEKINKNAAQRQLAKLCLNSFWGKFGQRNNMSKMEYFDELVKYFEVVCDEENEVDAIRIIDPVEVAVTYHKAEDFVEALPNTNSVIAAYVTAQARLKLYSYIEQLQSRVLYFDTDSIIYLSCPEDEYMPPIGDFLGDMTDELSDYGSGSYIQEFVAGGPKQYALKIWSTAKQEYCHVVKIRGFTLNSTTANELNFDNLKKVVLAFVESGKKEEISVFLSRIERCADRKVVTKNMKKIYRSVYDKRSVLSDGSTLPYGY